MISQELYRQIRRCKNDGLSQRATAKKLSIWRGTVAKYWEGGRIPGMETLAEPLDSAGKTALKSAMIKYFEEHKGDQTDKQSINAKILWRDLHFEYPRSQSTYRRYWAEIKSDRHISPRLPLHFSIGHTAEMDWVQVKVRHKGEIVKMYIFCMVLMYGYYSVFFSIPSFQRANSKISNNTGVPGIPTIAKSE